MSESKDSRLLRARRQLRAKFVIPAIGLIAVFIVSYFVVNRSPVKLQYASHEPDPMENERKSASDFEVKSATGGSFKLSQLKGKVVLITFWGADCATCLVELPAFQELKKRYQSEGLEVVAINIDSTEEGRKSARESWAKGRYEFESFYDPNRDIAKQLGVETLPSNFVIDRKGRKAFESFGANDWLAPETARLIEDLLVEPE